MYPQGLSFLPNNSRYLFLVDDIIKESRVKELQFLFVCNRANLPIYGCKKVTSG